MKVMRLQPKDDYADTDTKASTEESFSNGDVNERTKHAANDDGKGKEYVDQTDSRVTPRGGDKNNKYV